MLRTAIRAPRRCASGDGSDGADGGRSGGGGQGDGGQGDGSQGDGSRDGGRGVNALVRCGAAGLVVILAAAQTGCTQPASASGPRMELATAYVGQPQGSDITDAYLVIRNNGPADRLISARTSVGGTVTLRGPAGGSALMHDVGAITVPAHTLIRLVPNGYHLVIVGSRPMKADTEITLTLVFARAGAYRVAAEVTNPETGGSSYFLN